MSRTEFRLRRGDFALVADGSKALLFLNEGDANAPSLKAEKVLELRNAATREHGTDRPGHFDKGTHTRRGAFEATDLHEGAEAGFAVRIAEMLGQSIPAGGARRVVIVAPPRMLGHLRKHLPDKVRNQVVAELDLDLVNQPVDAIESILFVDRQS